MSRNERNERINYILKTYKKTSVGKINITRERLEGFSVRKLNEVYRKIRSLAQKEVYDKPKQEFPPQPKMKRQGSYELTEAEIMSARRDAVKFILDNSTINRQTLEKKSDRQISTIYNRLLKRVDIKTREKLKTPMRQPSQIDLRKMVEIQDRKEKKLLNYIVKDLIKILLLKDKQGCCQEK